MSIGFTTNFRLTKISNKERFQRGKNPIFTSFFIFAREFSPRGVDFSVRTLYSIFSIINKKGGDMMSSYEELEKEFNQKVKELREKCEHKEEDISDWMTYYWAPGHSSGVEVKICNRCKAIIAERRHCWQCGSLVEKPNWIEGDGKEVPIGTYFCSQKCLEEYKAAHKFPKLAIEE